MSVSKTPDKGRADALALMDLTKIMRAYVGGMLESISGYKGLLLDKETMRSCSTLFGRTELAEHNTVHVEKIDTDSTVEHMELHVSCGYRVPTLELLLSEYDWSSAPASNCQVQFP